MDILPYILTALAGLAVGWVCNVIAQRFPIEDRALIGPLRCVRSNERLRWYDSFPVFGWLSQGGRCRHCGKRLPLRFLVLELTIIASFVAAWPLYADKPFFMYLVVLFYVALFILIGGIDWKHRLIFPFMIYVGGFVAIIVSFFGPFPDKLLPDNVVSAILGAVFCGFATQLLYWLGIAAYRVRALGFGDVLLAILIGLTLGFPRAVAALFLGAIFGGITGIILLLTSKKRLRQFMPYGTGLCAGTVLILVFGDSIWRWGPLGTLSGILDLLFRIIFQFLGRLFGIDVS